MYNPSTFKHFNSRAFYVPIRVHLNILILVRSMYQSEYILILVRSMTNPSTWKHFNSRGFYVPIRVHGNILILVRSMYRSEYMEPF